MAKSNIAMLIQRWGGGKHLLTAGHPDFPWFFAIDTFLSARGGAMYTGEWRAVADTLRFLASRSSGGRIPHEVVTNGVVYNSGDLEESALFPAVVAEASMWRRSWRLFSELSDTVGRSVRYVWETGLTGRGGIMEDQDRGGSGIDIDTVCFFTRSLELLLTVPEGVLGATGLGGREEVGGRCSGLPGVCSRPSGSRKLAHTPTG
ncbi:hypothetical protein [Thermogymnomonas acidicola]|uniref:hypothetical protein n=1 Tax=Thermogymnomonas acidicola TaxID=399579 RepID=UPI0009467CB9|nr:hypothetical protein [Thermogymnomonas acidicola]